MCGAVDEDLTHLAEAVGRLIDIAKKGKSNKITAGDGDG
jgi:hypothetical protein